MYTFRTLLIPVLVIITAIVSVVTPASAADNPADAIAIVDKGLDYLQKNGKEALVREINAQNPMFVKGTIYLAMRAMDGTTLAHPTNPRLIGKNLIDLHDADGKYFRRDIIEVARSKGKGWVDYRYNNPATKDVESKSVYLVRSGDVILEAGIYKGK